MSDIHSLHSSLVSGVLEGDGRASPETRRAAFDNSGLPEPARSFVDNVALHARSVTGADIDSLKNAGLSEDEIYEIVVCAAIGQATRQYRSALVALDAAKESS